MSRACTKRCSSCSGHILNELILNKHLASWSMSWTWATRITWSKNKSKPKQRVIVLSWFYLWPELEWAFSELSHVASPSSRASFVAQAMVTKHSTLKKGRLWIIIIIIFCFNFAPVPSHECCTLWWSYLHRFLKNFIL